MMISKKEKNIRRLKDAVTAICIATFMLMFISYVFLLFVAPWDNISYWAGEIWKLIKFPVKIIVSIAIIIGALILYISEYREKVIYKHKFEDTQAGLQKATNQLREIQKAASATITGAEDLETQVHNLSFQNSQLRLELAEAQDQIIILTKLVQNAEQKFRDLSILTSTVVTFIEESGIDTSALDQTPEATEHDIDVTANDSVIEGTDE